MGFFKKLFEKKECSICGGEIGLLGNRKLEDGNCCKNCAGKLSPWFDDRRHSTIEQIKEQLAYREENQAALNTFRPTLRFGDEYTLRAELDQGVPSRFVVEQDNYREENADLIAFKDVTSFEIEIEEDEQELTYKNSEGEEVSYKPPRYEYNYDFYAQLYVNNPYFDHIRFQLNEETVVLEPASNYAGGVKALVKTRFDPAMYPAYKKYKAVCDELEELFKAGMQGLTLDGQAPAEQPPVGAAPDIPKFCPGCGAATDGGKLCQYCGTQF